ncbi:MAG: RNA polymerase sigma-70 factor [Bacteroides sp.]
MDEKELLLKLKEGDEESFTTLYHQYWRQVYNFCRLYISSKSEAEEIVQRVFVKLWESKELIREDDNFKGFLFIITRNMIFNNSRIHLTEEYYKSFLLSTYQENYDIEDEIDAKDLQNYINQLIEELPPQRKLIFKLSRNEYKSHQEIANQLNISVKTVENQIGSALKYLKRNILLFTLFLKCFEQS